MILYEPVAMQQARFLEKVHLHWKIMVKSRKNSPYFWEKIIF